MNSLSLTTLRQLCRVMLAVTDVDIVKRQLIEVCFIVQQLYHDDDDIFQVLSSLDDYCIQQPQRRLTL